MKSGLSTAKQTGSDALCLSAKGIQVVLRYYSNSSWKRLIKAEAQALTAAGIRIGVFYEDNPVQSSYFTKAQGQEDGRAAFSYAAQMSQPGGSCIYFTVDYDASIDDLPAITSYFSGVNEALTSASSGQTQYLVGVYGSGRVCDAIKTKQKLATFSCVANAPAWGGTKTYKDWDIKQSIGKASLCSFQGPTVKEEAEYEPCQVNDIFGGFMLPEPESVTSFSDGVQKLVNTSPTDPVAGLTFPQQARVIAEEQWLFFQKQTYDLSGHLLHLGKKEGEDGWYQRVGQYWLEGTNIYGIDGRNHDIPWSAAFISWVMKTAGAGKRFRYSTQ